MSKHAQIIRLLDLGFNRKQVARLVGCGEPYVRAVIQREFGNGIETGRKYYLANRDRYLRYNKQYQRKHRSVSA